VIIEVITTILEGYYEQSSDDIWNGVVKTVKVLQIYKFCLVYSLHVYIILIDC
jgi:hypothetical protein